MKRSTSRILTTHTGSLPRPGPVRELLLARDRRDDSGHEALAGAVRDAVVDVVRRQVETGLDVINDGEQGKSSYATYIQDRLTGYEGESRVRQEPTLDEVHFPEWAKDREGPLSLQPRPLCTGSIAWKDREALQTDIATLKAAAEDAQVEDLFITSASPGVISTALPNEYYPSHEAYLQALAEVMREEYAAIVRAGLVLQLDCPDLAMSRQRQFSNLSVKEFRRIVALHVDAINYAVAELPPDRMRLHLCWGNSPGPHNHDIPLNEIVDLVLKARPAALSFEGANPRHAHEWKVWQDVKLPEGKVIMPGVLDSTTNFIEHPELVAERIVRYAQLVGRENVIAGSDCGYGTSAYRAYVYPEIVWAKLRSLVEGARLASAELW